MTGNATGIRMIILVAGDAGSGIERTYSDQVSGGRAGTAVSSKTAGTVQSTHLHTAFPTGPAGLEPATPGFGVLTTLLRLAAGVCAQICAQPDPVTLIPLAGRL